MQIIKWVKTFSKSIISMDSAKIKNDYKSPIEIWNSPRILELRAQLESENYDVMCKNCPLVQNSLAD
jgi:hypothetical protein